MRKAIIGFEEKIIIAGKKFKARVDTGAQTSSIDNKIAKKYKLGPVIKKTRITSANGHTNRPVIRITAKIGSRKITANFNIADRSRMTFPVLIGRNILKQGFIIDPSR
jgi:hypothetical protein